MGVEIGERSDLERRLIEAAKYPRLQDTDELIRLLCKAVEAIGEARRAMREAEAYWQRWDMEKRAGIPAFLVLTRAALAKLEGGDRGTDVAAG